jgi:cephalosporin hydroxylase
MEIFNDPTQDVLGNTQLLLSDSALRELSKKWMEHAITKRYLYNFTWLGRPIIQLPQDIYALQEIFWEVKPDLVIETGVAHGGTLALFSSLLRLLDVSDCIQSGQDYNPTKPNRIVIGIDIEIRKKNRDLILQHPLLNNVYLIEGDSKSESVISTVRAKAGHFDKILVVLDSNHTKDHVRAELDLYSKFVSANSYIVVMDTFVEELSEHIWGDKDYRHGDNPKVACEEFLKLNSDFQVNHLIDGKLLLSSSPGGFLRKNAF